MSAPTFEEERCAECRKPKAICVCDRIEKADTRLAVLVLQHPQENDVDLGTVPILLCGLRNSVLRVGLSWPSLQVLLEGTDWPADPSRWAVIFPAKLDRVPESMRQQTALLLDRKSELRKDDAPPLFGLVVLDGTWSQGKALWWRNPWLLKLNRVVLHPPEPSIYGKMRKEPRREHVSTLEAVAEALTALGEPASIRDSLRRAMRTMIQRARDARS